VDERIQARHLLQVLSEQAKAVRNAVEPATGVSRITDEAWFGQWAAMTKALDDFTEGVREGRPPAPYNLGDRNVLGADHPGMAQSSRKIPFRAGGPPGEALHPAVSFSGAYTLLADVSEFEPDVADAAYLAWSKAIIIRAAYGDAHDDKAWYAGTRRSALHQGGAEFLGIYQYLVNGQPGAAQAQAVHALVGGFQKNEVLVADFEEGQHAMLTDWYNEMLTLGYPGQFLWTYTGLYFGQAQGALPVQWLADYTSTEPSSPHTLWQFSSGYTIPGVGVGDCSLYHGTTAELSALAYQGGVTPPAPAPFGPPRNLQVQPGKSSVLVSRCDPPATLPAPVDHYEISVFTGSYPTAAALVPSYPRYMKAAPAQFGGLDTIPVGEHMTLRAIAHTAGGQASQYADVAWVMA
jgi:hypothetical protein